MMIGAFLVRRIRAILYQWNDDIPFFLIKLFPCVIQIFRLFFSKKEHAFFIGQGGSFYFRACLSFLEL